jgi:methionyl-tRNA formyltransferase
MGTAILSCHALRGLIKWPGCQVEAVVTQPDRPKGRDLHLQASPVKQIALEAGLLVIQPERARAEEFRHEVERLRPDLIVVAAYGQILPQALLDVPRFGCLNVHTSLLPKYRGAAPIQWALLNDEQETGVTIMKMDAGLDTGAILTQEATTILPGDTSETLHDRIAELGAALLVETIPAFVAGRIQPRPQPADQASYAPKIKKEDGRIDWHQPVRAIWNRTRALVPWPGAFTFLPAEPKPHLLKIWQAEVAQFSGAPGHVLHADKNGILVACGQGAIRILSVQREGGRRITAQQFLTGHALRAGDHFC